MRARIKVVGASGFEPPASWSRTRRASQAALRPDSRHPGAIETARVEYSEYHSSTPRPRVRNEVQLRPAGVADGSGKLLCYSDSRDGEILHFCPRFVTSERNTNFRSCKTKCH